MTLRKTSTERLRHHRMLFQPYPQTDLQKFAPSRIIENSCKFNFISIRNTSQLHENEIPVISKHKEQSKKTPHKEHNNHIISIIETNATLTIIFTMKIKEKYSKWPPYTSRTRKSQSKAEQKQKKRCKQSTHVSTSN